MVGIINNETIRMIFVYDQRISMLKYMEAQMLTDNKFIALLIGSIFLSLGFIITKSKAEQLQASCKDSLSKNARVIHDRVIGKQSDNSDLKELWKEVTRELITENILVERMRQIQHMRLIIV